jgi:hypothetical protein
MAWRKVTLDEDRNLRCDISDEDIHVAVQDIKNQLRDAGVIIHKKSVPKLYYHNGVIGKKPVSERRASSKISPRGKSSGRKNKIALAMRRKREKV